jgi:hypothetical protein
MVDKGRDVSDVRYATSFKERLFGVDFHAQLTRIFIGK